MALSCFHILDSLALQDGFHKIVFVLNCETYVMMLESHATTKLLERSLDLLLYKKYRGHLF
jgi:hypothetical protein